MAITNEIQKDIIALVVGMFDAAPGQAILEELATAYEGGASITDLANHLAGTAQFKSLYPTILTNEQFSTRLVDAMVGGLVSADDRQWAIDALTGSLNSGASRGETALEAVNALRAVESSNAGWADAAAAFENKIDVAQYFSITLGKNSDSLSALQSVVANVDETAESVDAAKEAADQFGNVVGDDVFFLEAGRDNLAGTSGADLFIADVVANAEGRQVNSLATGDRLNGGAGYDTLEAQITRGATFGDSNMAIQPRTTSVEKVLLEAQNADLPNAGGNTSFPATNTQVYVNATDMTSLDYIGSDHSSADLIIQNLTTRTDAGQLRNTSEVTIGMRYTNPSDTNWQSSDLHVYFAQNNLISDIETTIIGSQANYWLLDQDSEQLGGVPLGKIDRDGIRFTLDGVDHLIRPADEVLLAANTWEEYADILRTELARLVNGGGAGAQLAGIDVVVDHSNIRQTFNDAGQLVSIPAITLIDKNGGVFSGLGFTIPDDISGDFNVFGRTDTLPPETDVSAYVTATIELEKVGRGADGGELVVGGMSKNSTNTWTGVQGVEQFNVNVVGGEDLPNWLSGLHSTNNQLQIVNIASVAGGDASLAIGSGSADYGLKDVRVLNGAEFNGDLSVSAELTTESISKYFDLNDAQGDAALDDIFFDYSLTGSGDNSLVLDVAQDISAHDDFVLTVLTGAGNDSVNVSIDGAQGGTLATNWYADQSALANVSIATGAGDDVIRTPGSGDIIIDAGSGNDTVYTDNTGDNAIWITNGQNFTLQDLLGAGVGDSYFLWNSTLTVTFSSATGVGASAADDSENGHEVTVTIPTSANNVANHTHINQAIKNAINNDPVLSKLLEAKDGPNFALVIESLVDGVYSADDLEIVINGPTAASITALSAGQKATLLNNYKAFVANSNYAPASDAAFAADIVAQGVAASDGYQGVSGSQLANNALNFQPALPAVPASPLVLQEVTVGFDNLVVNAAGDIVVTITLDGVDYSATLPFTNVGPDDGTTIATAFAALDETDFVDEDSNAIGVVGEVFDSLAQVGETLVITFTEDVADSATVAVSYDGIAFDAFLAVAEQQTIDFNGVSITTDGNILVGGVVVAVSVGDTAADLATNVAAALNGNALVSPPTVGTVTAAPVGTVVTIDYDVTDGNLPAITVVADDAAFTGTPVVATPQQFVQPTSGEVQEIDFTGVTILTNGTIIVGGRAVAVVAGDTDAAIAAKVAAAIDTTNLLTPATDVAVNAFDTGPVVTVEYSYVDGDVALATVAAGTASYSGTPVVVTEIPPINIPAATVEVTEDFSAEVDFVPAQPAIGQEYTGSNSTAETDNTINMGTGDDVLVLSTSAEANETLVWTGLNNGVNTIINFSVDGSSADVLDFTAYLTNMTSASGSAESAVDITTTLAADGSISASEVVVTTFASLNAGTGISWANLTAATLASTLNAAVNNGVWTVAATTNLVGTTQKAVFMIENGANDGEYKIFEVSMANTTSNTGFTGVGLIGVADFGDSLTGIISDNFVA